jgi:hypothetical protein
MASATTPAAPARAHRDPETMTSPHRALVQPEINADLNEAFLGTAACVGTMGVAEFRTVVGDLAKRNAKGRNHPATHTLSV